MNGEIKKLNSLVKRNIKVYFTDKSLFLVSLITPMILIVLFLTFLGKVYEDSLLAFLPNGLDIPQRLLKGFTGGWLFSSILTTSCITVAFCSNVLVNDKINKAIDDFHITPVKRATVQLSYFLANFLTTLIVCVAALAVGMIYLALVGWYLSVMDIFMLLLVVLINTLFGTLLASIIEMFINSPGALSAVCTLISSMYGFICGAYMPISQFSRAIRLFVGFLPGTYATVLFRKYFMRGTLKELGEYLPDGVVAEVEKSFDGQITMFNHVVPTGVMFTILLGAVIMLLAVYFLINYLLHKAKIQHKKMICVAAKRFES